MQHYASEGDYDESAYALASAPNGDCFAVGRAHLAGAEEQLVAMRLDGASGDILWLEYDGGPLDDRGTDCAVDADGNLVVTGIKALGGGEADLYTIKYDGADGRRLWTQERPGAAEDANLVGWVGIAANGDAIVSNRTWAPGVSFDVMVERYAAEDGALVWSTQYHSGGTAADDPRAMLLASDDDPLVVGVSAGDWMVLRFDAADGGLRWDSFLDGPMGWFDMASCLALGPEATVLVAGYTDSGASTWDATCAAFDLETGVELWQLSHDGPDGLTDEARALALSGDGDLYLGGYTYALASDMDMLALRYEFMPTAVPAWPAADRGLTAWPNPFTERSTVRLGLAAAGPIDAAVYDARGRLVRRLAQGEHPAGELSLVWDGADASGRLVPAGVYLLRVGSGGEERTARLLRLR